MTEKNFVCVGCDRVCDTQTQLNTHMKISKRCMVVLEKNIEIQTLTEKLKVTTAKAMKFKCLMEKYMSEFECYNKYIDDDFYYEAREDTVKCTATREFLKNLFADSIGDPKVQLINCSVATNRELYTAIVITNGIFK